MTCPCSIHPRRNHTDACRICASKHVPTPPAAAVSAFREDAVVPRRQPEASVTRQLSASSSTDAS